MTTKTTYYNYRNDEGGYRHNWVYVKEYKPTINWWPVIITVIIIATIAYIAIH